MDASTGAPAVLLAIIIVVITIAILVHFRKRGKRHRTVLITGLSDAGKTVLYSRLVTGTVVKTVTSMVKALSVFVMELPSFCRWKISALALSLMLKVDQRRLRSSTFPARIACARIVL